MALDQRDAYIEELEERIDQLKTAADVYEKSQIALNHELKVARADAGRILYALDCAIQLIEQLIIYLPDGSPISEQVAGCKLRLDHAMSDMRRGHVGGKE